MGAKVSAQVSTQLLAGMKLAKLYEMSEREIAVMTAKLEAKHAFSALVSAGAVRIQPFAKAFFAARRFAGVSLAARDTGLAEILDGKSDLVRLLKKLGHDTVAECFIGSGQISDAERVRRTGLSSADVGRLREFFDRMYIREMFEPPAPAAPVKTYSSVAGIALSGGIPVLKFFHREVWKGRYSVDKRNLAALLADSGPADRRRLERLVSRLEFVDRRKTTLYRLLECLLRSQVRYFKSGEPADLQPLTQRDLAAAIASEPSVINRLLAHKSVELPWGTEVPMRCLCPSAKSLAREVLGVVARREPHLSDEALCRELAEHHQIQLSRRSVAQYRKELGLGGQGNR